MAGKDKAEKKTTAKSTKTTEASVKKTSIKKTRITSKEASNGTTQESSTTKTQTAKKGQEVKPASDVDASKTEEAKTAKASTSPSKPLAKSGKRSAKALTEAEEKQKKEARKAEKSKTQSAEESKSKTKPARPRAERRGKGYRKAAEQIEKGKRYSLTEAVELAAKTSPVKFDATVELHVRLGVDPRQADQNVRGTVVLPSGTGKTIRVAVFADDDKVSAAQKVGADIAANDTLLQQLDKEDLNFDVLISTPAMMPRLGQYARLLGPKGLMPNPKSGTVTNDIVKAVAEAKAGRVEYRVDSTSIIHVAIGKVSFGKDKLDDNLRAITSSIKTAKPSSLKGTYVRSAFVTTSMGPSIPIEVSEIN